MVVVLACRSSEQTNNAVLLTVSASLQPKLTTGFIMMTALVHHLQLMRCQTHGECYTVQNECASDRRSSKT
jgi:hypothetical protein